MVKAPKVDKVKALKVDKVKVKKNLLQKPKPKPKPKPKQTEKEKQTVQTQTQGVVVNVNKPAPRKRTPKKIQPKSLEQKSFFQPPIYLPPANQITKLAPPPPEIKIENQLEKKKPVEEPEAKKSTTKVLLSGSESLIGGVGSLLGGAGSLVGGTGSLVGGIGSVLSGIYNTKPNIIPIPEISNISLPKKLKDAIITETKTNGFLIPDKFQQAPLIAEPKISFLQQVKYEPPKKQAWAELEVGETKEETIRKEFKNPPFTQPFVFDEPPAEPIIPASEPKAPVDQDFFDAEDEPEEPEAPLEPEAPPAQLEAPLEPFGEPQQTGFFDPQYLESLKDLTSVYKTQQELLRKQVEQSKPVEQSNLKDEEDLQNLKIRLEQLKKPTILGYDVPSFFEKLEIAREKPPPIKLLAIKEEEKPKDSLYSFASEQTDEGIKKKILKEYKKPLRIQAQDAPMGEGFAPMGAALSPEQDVTPDIDPQVQQLKKLKRDNLQNILVGMGGKMTYQTVSPMGEPVTSYKNKTMLSEEIIGLRKTQPDKFTQLLNAEI